MPSTYAHFKFGKEILKRLPESLKRSADLFPELFAIGQHGPDILFYYKALTSNPVNQTGYGMHDRKASEFFEPALDVIRGLKEDKGERAYIYGFVCHFILDSTVHWYIEDKIAQGEVSHTQIEGELDRILMEEDGLDPVRYMPASHIVPSMESARVISEFFPGISPEEICKSLKDMIFYNKLLCCPNKAKRKLVTGVLKAAHHEEMIGMVIRYEPDPRCADSNIILRRLFDAALDEALKYLVIFEEASNTKKSLPERFYRTFGPDKESKEEYEIYKA